MALARWGLVLALLLPALPAAAETVLLLGVLRDGKLDPRLSRAVQERLLRGGEIAVSPSELTPAERQCATSDCLDALAGRQKAQLVLSAHLQQSAGFAYIAALLYDVAHQRKLDVSAVCDKCLPEALTLRVGDLFQRLLHDQRDRVLAEGAAPRRPPPLPVTAGKAPPLAPAPVDVAQTAPRAPASGQAGPMQHAPPPPPITAPPPEEPAQRQAAVVVQAPAAPASAPVAGHSKPYSPRRKLIAGVLGGLGVLTLATAIAFHVTDGNPTTQDCAAAPGMPKYCVLDNRLAYTAGYAATSVLAVSLGMTLVWPEPAKSTRSEVK